MTSPYPGAANAPQPGYIPPAPAPKKSKVPMILIIVGAVILVLSIVVGGIVAALGIGTTASGVGEIEVHASGSGTFSAEAGEEVYVYAEEGTAAPACNVTGPGEITLGSHDVTYTTTIEGTSWESFDVFTVAESGTYEIDCYGEAVAVGPPVSVGGILGAVGGILGGLLGAFLGFVILLVGVIMVIIRRRKAA